MGWGISAAVSAKLDNQELYNLLGNDKNTNELYDKCVDFLNKNRMRVDQKIKNAHLFQNIKYFNSFVSTNKTKYDNLKEYLLYEDYCITWPPDAVDFLILMAVLSTYFPKQTLRIGIGDMSYCWLDIDFVNGVQKKVDVTFHDWDKNETIQIENHHLDEIYDCFACTKEEIIDFFSTPILSRYNNNNYTLKFNF